MKKYEVEMELNFHKTVEVEASSVDEAFDTAIAAVLDSTEMPFEKEDFRYAEVECISDEEGISHPVFTMPPVLHCTDMPENPDSSIPETEDRDALWMHFSMYMEDAMDALESLYGMALRMWELEDAENKANRDIPAPDPETELQTE